MGDMNAFDILLEAYNERIDIDNKYGMTASALHLAEFELAEGKFAAAKSYAQHAYELAYQNGDSKNLLKALSFLSRNYGTPEYVEHYIRLQDSLKLYERQMSNKFASIDFQSEQQKKENESLRADIIDRNNQIEKNKLRSRLLLTSIVSIALVFSFIIYVLMQKRKAREKELAFEKYKAVQEERNNISAHLHDEVASDLLTGIHRTDAIAQQIGNDDLSQVVDLFDRSYEKMRSIAHKNNSISYDKIPFEQRISRIVSDYSEGSKIEINVNGLSYIQWKEIAPHIKNELLLIIKEAMNNIIKHAKAAHSSIQFKSMRDSIECKVSDNGKGLNSVESRNGFGMTNMQQRVADLGGTIKFNGTENVGTEIKINIPI